MRELNKLKANNFEIGEWDYSDPKRIADDIIHQFYLPKSNNGKERWGEEINTQVKTIEWCNSSY